MSWWLLISGPRNRTLTDVELAANLGTPRDTALTTKTRASWTLNQGVDVQAQLSHEDEDREVEKM